MKRKVAKRLFEIGYIGEADRILKTTLDVETGVTRQLTKGILYCMIDIALTLRAIHETLSDIAENSKETMLDAH